MSRRLTLTYTLTIVYLFLLLRFGYSQSVNYAYDPVGNRVSKTMTIRSDTVGSYNGVDRDDTYHYTDIVDDMSIKIYPNPTRGLFKVEFPFMADLDKLSIELYNISGIKLLLLEVTSSPQLVDISHYDSGVYLMRININGIFSEWIIIKE